MAPSPARRRPNPRRPSARRPVPRRIARLALLVPLVVAACGSEAVDDAVAQAEQTVESATGADVVTYGEAFAAEVDDPDLSSLTSAMDLAAFSDLDATDAFTFFAPNDPAFAALDPDDLADLLADPDALAGVLRAHLVDRTVMAADLPDSTTSVGGLQLEFDTTGDIPTVNGVSIVRTDVMVDGGVVHVIDGVLLADN